MWRAIPAVLILLAVFVGLVFAVKAITGLGARRDEAAATIWLIAVTLAVVYSIAHLAFGEAVDKFIDRILGFFESDREV